MKKFKMFYNFEKEEHWLTEMAAQGHFLKRYSGFGVYTFFDSTPQTLTYKIDYKQFKRTSDYLSYLSLFEDAGWQHIFGSISSGCHYFIPKNNAAGTEIFSDAASANARYKLLSRMCILMFTVWIIYFTATLSLYHFDFAHLFFMTPGLWAKSGMDFLSSFLFELPFAIFRIGMWLLLLGMGIKYAYWAIRVKKEYHSEMKSSKNTL